MPDVASESVEKYDYRAVQLIGWGTEAKRGKTSSTLERVTLEVFPQR